MVRPSWVILLGCLLGSMASTAQAKAPQWETDYAKAWKKAEQSEKLLLILFTDRKSDSVRAQIEQQFGSSPDLQEKLENFVVARLPVSATIKVSGKRVKLLEHGAFAEMHSRPGLAIVDLAHRDEEYYGHVVSAFPFASFKYYSFRTDYLPIILGLPRGTLTQRTMVWAVRIHPERPQSTQGKKSVVLVSAAKEHSQHQASIGVQGHHRWETRFHLLRRLLGGHGAPVEVVAESWPNQNLVDSCIDCVDSWRHSSGHWNAVKSPQNSYGYDIKRGSNGIWYGTGIFAN